MNSELPNAAGIHPDGVVGRLATLRARALEAIESIQGLAPLLGRLAVGLLFLSTGWGKVHSLDKVTEYFEELGIPAAAFNAVLVGYSELVCGVLLVVGLATRFATVPLIVSMIVAIATAKKDKLHGLFDLVGFEEFTYLVVLIIVALLGPGPVSLDHLAVKRWLRHPSEPSTLRRARAIGGRPGDS